MSQNPSQELVSREFLEADFHMNPNFQEQLQFIQVEDNTRIVTTKQIPSGTLIYFGEPMLYYTKPSDNNNRISRVLCVLTMINKKDFDILDKTLEDHYPYNEEDYFSYLNIRYPGYGEAGFNKHYSIDLKIQANSFRSKGNLSILYNIPSKFNHSCSPNCLQIISGDELKMSVWSIRDMEVGEECTITYLDPVLRIANVEERRRALLEGLYFNCMCTYCVKGISQEFNDIYNENMKCLKNAVGFCSQCKDFSVILSCSRCKKVSYCGKKCQKLDWSKHKLICEK